MTRLNRGALRGAVRTEATQMQRVSLLVREMEATAREKK